MVAEGLEAAKPFIAVLCDAQAELRSYRNLVSPKTLATWASLLG